MPKPTKKEQELEQHIGELTADIQRLRADFENYRKRIEVEKSQLTDTAKAATIIKLLPVIDNIERAIIHVPDDLAENAWVKGVTNMAKGLEKSLNELGLQRINATPDTAFNPHFHEAVMADEAEGEHEVIAEELRGGYTFGGQVVRPSMVKVTKK